MVQELGGTPHRETLEERAARHEREARFKREREAALDSHEGVVAFHAAIEKTRTAIRDGLERINKGRSIHRLAYRSTSHPSGPCAVTGLRYALMIQGRAVYSNTLEGANSEATIWKNGFPWPGAFSFDEPQKYRTLRFNLNYLPTQAYAWQVPDQDGAFTPEELADEILKWYLDNGGDPA